MLTTQPESTVTRGPKANHGKGVLTCVGGTAVPPCEVLLWWTQHSNRNTKILVEIYDGDLLLDVPYIDQTINGGQRNVLGTYSFAGSAKVVFVSKINRYSTCADAVNSPKNRLKGLADA